MGHCKHEEIIIRESAFVAVDHYRNKDGSWDNPSDDTAELSDELIVECDCGLYAKYDKTKPLPPWLEDYMNSGF